MCACVYYSGGILFGAADVLIIIGAGTQCMVRQVENLIGFRGEIYSDFCFVVGSRCGFVRKLVLCYGGSLKWGENGKSERAKTRENGKCARQDG